MTAGALEEFSGGKSEGYALSYNKLKGDLFLEETDPEEVKRVVKKRGGQNRRKGKRR